ncbi:MAG: thioredoxin fold domain-containing protein [Aquificae bacterium]|nr:thioredoxin fold domain-containing protein [Aquificota bacterium]
MFRRAGVLLILLAGLLWASQSLYREVVKEIVKELPLDKAVVLGKGERKLIVFVNPDCGHCRREWSHLRKHLDKLRIYAFVVPFAHWGESNLRKVYYILCSEDQQKAFDEVLSGKLDGVEIPKKECDLLGAHLRAAEIVGLQAVPLNILPEEGIIIEGASPTLYRILGIE